MVRRAATGFAAKNTRFEGRAILHCEFKLKPELPTRPIINDIYKRIPNNICQKLRKPHLRHVFGDSSVNAYISGNQLHAENALSGRRPCCSGAEIRRRYSLSKAAIWKRRIRSGRGARRFSYAASRGAYGESSNLAQSAGLFPLLVGLRKESPCSQMRDDALGNRGDRSGCRPHPLSGHRGILKGNDAHI